VSTRTEEEARARARLDAKRDDRDALLVRGASRVEELSTARADLDGTLPLLIDREAQRRDSDLRVAAGIVADEAKAGRGVAGDMAPDVRARFAAALTRAEQHDDRVRRFEQIAESKRAELRVSVKREPRTYQEDGPHSYFRDLWASSLPGHRDYHEASKRLKRHGREVMHEAIARTPEGVRALRSVATRSRERAQEEQRALTTGASSAGAFVVPQYLVGDWAVWHSYPPAFLRQCVEVEDQGFGMEMLVPSFDSPADAGQQTETAGVPTASPTGGYVTAALLPFAGEIDISQQLLDRSGPGPSFDKLAQRQIMEQLWTSVDAYAVDQAIAAGTAVTGASSFTAAGLYGDLAKAKAAMSTTDGTRLPATHVFMQSDFCDWALAQADPNGRPLLLPTPSNVALPIVPGRDGGPPAGFSGTRLLSTAVFSDGSIPATGSNTQILVCNMAEVFALVSEVALSTIPETTFASSLSVVVQARCVAGVLVRHGPAVEIISGNAYPASPSFA
jgi:HK97 family phage major capsid protein